MTNIGESFTGTVAGYRWFQSAQLPLGHLLATVPALVVGRYLAVTANDSGPLDLTADELRSGWMSTDGVAYSPRIAAPDEIPQDQYDEWYVFPQPVTVGTPEVFVNCGGFGLRSPHLLLDNLDPTWDRRMAQAEHDAIAASQERFWGQLVRLQAETYLAEGDNLICVTRNEGVWEALADFFGCGRSSA